MSDVPTRILLVEDNPGDANLLRIALKKTDGEGFAVEHVQELTRALALLEEAQYEAILLDLNLPDSHGIDTVKRIQKTAPQIPIIVLTGNDDGNVGIEAVQAGASDYMVKGSRDSLLLSRSIRYSIERHRAVVRMQELDRLKSEFLNTASHEMRTPLTIIREFLSLLIDGVVGPVTPDQTECLQDALRNCDRLTALLNDLLDLSKLDSNNMEIYRRKVELLSILHACYRDFLSKCKSKNQCLALDLPDTLPPILADPDKITQVIVNLLGNACKFTPEGGTITLRVTEQSPFACIEVQDTGRGISKEAQKIIFDAFTQIDREDGPGARGTGLGLAITQRIIRAHEGTISVESELGQGSSFCVQLPFYQEEAHLALLVADKWKVAQRKEKAVCLALLRLVSDEQEEKEDAEARQEKLSQLRTVAERNFRLVDEGLLDESTALLAFVLESDEAGGLIALQRLQETLRTTCPEMHVEAALSELTPLYTAEEWIQRSRDKIRLLT